jgi:hypothetical protein
MRNLYRIAALVLLAQFGLGGAARACDGGERSMTPALAGHGEHAEHGAPEAPRQHHGTQQCDHGPAVSCAAMTACGLMVVVTAPTSAAAVAPGQSPIDGLLLADAERSEQPELPPPRI